MTIVCGVLPRRYALCFMGGVTGEKLCRDVVRATLEGRVVF